MAFLSDYADDDPGDRCVIGTDEIEENGVKKKVEVALFVRPVPFDKQAEFNRAFGRPEKIVADGKATIQRVLTEEQRTELNIAIMLYILVDTENFTIHITNAAAAQSWSGMLRQKIEVGQTIKLDGIIRENDAVKKALFDRFPAYMMLVGKLSDEVRRKRQGFGEELLGN